LIDQPRQAQLTGWRRALVLFLDHQIYQLSRHWLAALNLLMGVYTLLPVLAPVLMANGASQAGNWIHILYRPACHQLPERSFFLFGPQMTYTVDELWALGLLPETDVFSRALFRGAPEVGYKMAMCQRDIALYGGLFLGGMLFSLVRKRLKPLPLLVYGLLLLPMAIDGGTQILALRESNWMWRTLTGGLVGLASVWTLYPHVEAAFEEIRWQASQRAHTR
jgi:uncharacterized membrane protein